MSEGQKVPTYCFTRSQADLYDTLPFILFLTDIDKYQGNRIQKAMKSDIKPQVVLSDMENNSE